jgi:hypothetical protein
VLLFPSKRRLPDAGVAQKDKLEGSHSLARTEKLAARTDIHRIEAIVSFLYHMSYGKM